MAERPERSFLSKTNLAYRGVPKEFFNSDINEYPIDEDKKQFFTRYMKYLPQMVDEKVNVVLYGSNGSGKTYLTSLLVKEAYKKRYSAFRVTLETLIQLHFKQDEESKEKLSKICSCELLVIDEVGKETQMKNDFHIVKFEEIMRQRDTEGLVTILCMNLPLEGAGGFYEQYGNSLKDLVEGNAFKLEFVGDSNRKSVTARKKAVALLLGEED